LLLPGLGATASDLGPGPGRLGAGPLGGELGGDDLVHDGHVGLDAEGGVVELDGARGGTGGVVESDRGHQAAPSLLAERFTALRSSTTPPVGPGTAPRTRMTSWSVSALTTSRFRVVTLVPPVRPAMRTPLNTRAGVAHWPVEPGLRCTRCAPCEAPWPLKPWRFMAPAKPLPLLTAVTSIRSPAADVSASRVWPTSYAEMSSSRSSTSRTPGSTSPLA